MKGITRILGRDQKRLLRLGLLFVSTIAIISISALVYARAVFQKALNVGATDAVNSGSGSTNALGGSITPLVVILALQAFVFSLSALGFPPKLPKLPRLFHKEPAGGLSPESLRPKSQENNESNEFPSTSEIVDQNKDIVEDILESLQKKSATVE